MPCVIAEYLSDFFIMMSYQNKYLKGNIIGFEKSDRQYEVVDKKTKEKVYLDLYYPIVSFTIYGEERVEKSYSVTVKYIYDMFEYDINENLDKTALINDCDKILRNTVKQIITKLQPRLHRRIGAEIP